MFPAIPYTVRSFYAPQFSQWRGILIFILEYGKYYTVLLERFAAKGREHSDEQL